MSKNKIVAFGEILLRLTPEYGQSLETTQRLECCYGGSEANVMIALSSLGDKTSYITILPENSLGKAVEYHLHKYQIDTSYIQKQGSVLGSYYLEPGAGKLPSKVIYNRKCAEIAQIEENYCPFDFDDIFNNCRLFHISGISFALSQNCQQLCFRFLEEAKKRMIPISFDFNYRKSLWSIEEAKKVYQKIVPYVDVLFCSSKDMEAFLDTTFEKFLTYSNCKYIIRRERQILSSTRHRAYSEIWHRKNHTYHHVAYDPFEFEVVERIGSGDAFCAGVLHALLANGENIEYALEFGMSCFELKHYCHGDTISLSEKEVLDFLNNQNKDIGR